MCLNVSASNAFVLRETDIVIVNSEMNPPKSLRKLAVRQAFTLSVSRASLVRTFNLFRSSGIIVEIPQVCFVLIYRDFGGWGGGGGERPFLELEQVLD